MTTVVAPPNAIGAPLSTTRPIRSDTDTCCERADPRTSRRIVDRKDVVADVTADAVRLLGLTQRRAGTAQPSRPPDPFG